MTRRPQSRPRRLHDRLSSIFELKSAISPVEAKDVVTVFVSFGIADSHHKAAVGPFWRANVAICD